LRRRGLAEPVASEDEPADEDEPGSPDTEAGDPAPDAADPTPDAAGATDEPKQHANHAKVETALRERGIEPQVRVFNDATPPAARAAEKPAIEVGATANSLTFSSSGAPVPTMTSGPHRAATDHVANPLGIDSRDPADKDLVREATGQVIGGVAPCGHPEPIPTYVDVALRDHPVLWAAAGTPNSMMSLTYEQLLEVTDGKEITVVAEES